MRLLITNARCSQAYFVLRALRPFADWVTVTMSGPPAMGFWPTCHAAYSRLVDRRCRVPHPEADWQAGRIQPTNTVREQAFVDEMLRICERDRIDTIFPSNDPWVYVLAKNKPLFASHGVLIPVPDYDAVIKPLDKYDTVRCAREVGFPVPASCLYENSEGLEAFLDETTSPWMIRPRFTNGSRGMRIETSATKLAAAAAAVAQRYGAPMIQEYVPGNRIQNFYIVLDKVGRPVSVFTPKVLRTYGRIVRNTAGSAVSQAHAPYSAEAVRLLAHLGWWGGATVQTKTDARDGQPKLMEVNPRLGQYLWTRTELGINEPLLCLQIARGESPEPIVPGKDYPLDCLLLEPIADVTNFLAGLVEGAVFGYRRHVLRKASLDPDSAPPGIGARLRAYRREYFGARCRVFHPSFRYMLEDPRPCLLWASKKIESATRMLVKGLARH
jgi:biotin carboxylase